MWQYTESCYTTHLRKWMKSLTEQGKLCPRPGISVLSLGPLMNCKWPQNTPTDRQKTIWLLCLPACLFSAVSISALPPEAWLTKALQGGGEMWAGLGWAMDALSIMAALAGGLRSRRVVVRERWSVRSQQSLTTPDPSFRQQQPRICLRGDSKQNGFFHSGQRAMCWP